MKITNEAVHTALDEVLSEVSLNAWDKQRIVYQACEAQKRKPRRPRVLRRVCMLAATFVLASALAVGALAVPDLAEKLSMLSRQTLSYLRPVEKEKTASSIRAEVIAAMNDGDTVIVYVSLQDISGKGRLDDSVQSQGMMLEGLDTVSQDNVYQKDDGTVIMRIVGQSDKADLSGRKVTLKLDTLLSQNEYLPMQDTGYTVADIVAQNPNPVISGYLPSSCYSLYGDISGTLYNLLESGKIPALQPSGQMTADTVPWARVRSAGVVDGLLHILQEPDQEYWYNSAEYVLGDVAGNGYDTETAVVKYGELDKAQKNRWSDGMQWNEQLLELPSNVAYSDMHLYRNMNTYGVYIQDEWDVTFTLQQVTPAVRAACDKDMGTWRMESIAVSSIGVTITGTGQLSDNMDSPDVTVTMADGTTIQETDSWMSSMTAVDDEGNTSENNGRILHKYLFEEPIAQNQIRSVSVNGEVVWQAQ